MAEALRVILLVGAGGGGPDHRRPDAELVDGARASAAARHAEVPGRRAPRPRPSRPPRAAPPGWTSTAARSPCCGIAGRHGLVYAFDEVEGGEIIVDGHVVARVRRGEPRKALDVMAPDAELVTLRLMFADARYPEFELALWNAVAAGPDRLARRGHAAGAALAVAPRGAAERLIALSARAGGAARSPHSFRSRILEGARRGPPVRRLCHRRLDRRRGQEAGRQLRLDRRGQARRALPPLYRDPQRRDARRGRGPAEVHPGGSPQARRPGAGRLRFLVRLSGRHGRAAEADRNAGLVGDVEIHRLQHRRQGRQHQQPLSGRGQDEPADDRRGLAAVGRAGETGAALADHDQAARRLGLPTSPNTARPRTRSAKGKLQPKSNWQMHGAGAVGGQTLVGIPMVRRLLESLGPSAAVWPFGTGWRDAGRRRRRAAVGPGRRGLAVDVADDRRSPASSRTRPRSAPPPRPSP